MNDIRNDKNLQEAVNRREQRLEPMPADLNDRLMKKLSQSLSEAEKGQAHPRLYAWRRWSVGLSAALAACFLLMWLFNFSQTPSHEAPLLAQQTQTIPSSALSEPVADESQPEVVASEQPMVQPSVMVQGESEPQTAEPAPTEVAAKPRHYNPQTIPDIASPKGELFLASTSHMIAARNYNEGLAPQCVNNDNEDDGLPLSAAANGNSRIPNGWDTMKKWSEKKKIYRIKTAEEIMQELMENDLTLMIANRRWHIDITSMNTMRYGSRTVTTDFFLELRGDTLRSYLPYLGQAQVSPSLSPSIGLNFEKPVKRYEKIGRKKYTEIVMDVRTTEDSYRYIVDVYPSGEAYIRVNSQNRDPISFDGTIELKP